MHERYRLHTQGVGQRARAVQRGTAEPRRRVLALQAGGWKSPLLFRAAAQHVRSITNPRAGRREESLPDEHHLGLGTLEAGMQWRATGAAADNLDYLQIRCRADTSTSIRCRAEKSCAA